MNGNSVKNIAQHCCTRMAAFVSHGKYFFTSFSGNGRNVSWKFSRAAGWETVWEMVAGAGSNVFISGDGKYLLKTQGNELSLWHNTEFAQ
jgi:hypothetical protein